MGTMSDSRRCQPEDGANPQVISKCLIDFLASEARIAHLNFWIQVTLFGGQHCSASVDINASAFENEILAICLRVEKPFAQMLGGAFRDAAVLLPIIVLGPGVEVKMD